jgi:hypothetical protein
MLAWRRKGADIADTPSAHRGIYGRRVRPLTDTFPHGLRGRRILGMPPGLATGSVTRAQRRPAVEPRAALSC